MTAELADGRRISWAEYGSPSGAPLVLLHGTPGSRLQFQSLHAAATAHGVRVVTPERPGYGLSDPAPGGVTYIGYADDLRQLLDHLELPTVTLAGVSGGGGFALVAAIVLPERIRRLVLVSAGLPAPGAALRGMSPAVRMLLWLAARAPGLTGRLLASQASADLDSATSRLGRRSMPEADRRVFDDPTWRASFEEDLTVDTVLLHGVDDVNVPIGIARWLAAQVPSSRLIETPGAGHLFTLERPQLVLDLVVG
jgi:pimeloyl-ACP methyl ester carboxylesterase